MMQEPYKGSFDSEGKPYVNGPGNGLNYYGGTLWPNLRFQDKEAADRAATIANIAYREGYLKAQIDIKLAMGIKL